MKTVGIIGGIGPESTIEYYRLIISSYLEKKGTGDYPQIIIYSINMKKMLYLVGTNDLDKVAEYLVSKINKLSKAGVDFALLASNTPHIAFNEINRLSPIPLISIVNAACDVAVKHGFKRVGLFGTGFTMKGGFYDEIFAEKNISVITPEKGDQDYIHEKYIGELVKGIIRDETKKGLITIARRLEENQGIDALILGGTELPLIIKETDNIGIPILDTTMIHVEGIVKLLLSD